MNRSAGYLQASQYLYEAQSGGMQRYQLGSLVAAVFAIVFFLFVFLTLSNAANHPCAHCCHSEGQASSTPVEPSSFYLPAWEDVVALCKIQR